MNVLFILALPAREACQRLETDERVVVRLDDWFRPLAGEQPTDVSDSTPITGR